MTHQLDGMRAKLAEAKRSLATLVARQNAANFRRRMEREPATLNTDVDTNAFAKFDRLKSKVEQAEAEAEAMAEFRRRQGVRAQSDTGNPADTSTGRPRRGTETGKWPPSKEENRQITATRSGNRHARRAGYRKPKARRRHGVEHLPLSDPARYKDGTGEAYGQRSSQLDGGFRRWTRGGTAVFFPL